MQIFLHGRDSVGWSIDSDRENAARFIKDLGYELTGNIFKAEIVHSVWWRQLFSKRSYPLRFKKKIITTATNQIEPGNDDFLKARKWAALWIAPSKRQLNSFREDGVEAAYQPFYVDEKIFKKLDKSKEEIAANLGIDPEVIKNKLLIGSFQRDTLARDLLTPKWQKDPETLIEILSLLPDRDKWLLILAGPRRHFIINECEKKGIPYCYYGLKPRAGVDDVGINTLERGKMCLLYNLIDCYLVTSKSEGGPKAILESSFCKTLIFSTDVGLAPDILDRRCVLNEVDTFTENLSLLLESKKQNHLDNLVENNFSNVNSICSYKIMKKRWKQIYESI